MGTVGVTRGGRRRERGVRSVAILAAITLLVAGVSRADAASLFLAGVEGITTVHLDGSGKRLAVPAGQGETPVDVAVDRERGWIYWADSGTDRVRRAHLDGTGAEDVVTGTDARGVALDEVNGRLYWLEGTPTRVRRAALDGSGPETVLSLPAYPDGGGIAVHPVAGWLFVNGESALLRADLDGGGLTAIAANAMPGRGVDVDRVNGRVYPIGWEGLAGQAVVSDLDGTWLNTEGVEMPDRTYDVAIDPVGGSLWWANRGWPLQRSSSGLTGREDWLPWKHPSASITSDGIAVARLPEARLEGPDARGLGRVGVGGGLTGHAVTISSADGPALAPGEARLEILEAPEGASGDAGFRVLGDGCAGARLAEGERCTVQVGFAPSVTGPARARVLIPVPGDPTATVAAELVGEGVTPPEPPAPIRCGAHVATIVGSDGDDVLTGTAGRDVVAALGGDDRILGLAGDDVICAGAGDDVVLAGAGDDVVAAGDGADRVIGGDGADRILGGADADRITGGDGADRIRGHAGADAIVGGPGDDRLGGDDGADRIEGRSGRDRILGGAGRDVVLAGGGDDVVAAGDGADRVIGGGGADRLLGGADADRIAGGGGADRIRGHAGNDRLAGGPGDDRVTGDAGADRLEGDAGRDLVIGLAGDDRLLGGAGPDLLSGGAGLDIGVGGPGRDRFRGVEFRVQ